MPIFCTPEFWWNKRRQSCVCPAGTTWQAAQPFRCLANRSVYRLPPVRRSQWLVRPTQPNPTPGPHRHVYTNSTQTVVGLDPSIVMEVVIIAEFMVLPSLTRACQCELGQYVDEDSASNLVDFAQRYRLLKLKSLCLERLREKHAVPAAAPRRDFRMKVDAQKSPPDYRRR